MKRATGCSGSMHKDLKEGRSWGCLGKKGRAAGELDLPGHLKVAPSGVVLFKLCQEQVDQRRESMSLCVLSTSP